MTEYTPYCTDGWKGKCCCNCTMQLEVRKHPWNKIPEAKGSISEVMGYMCTLDLTESKGERAYGIFFDRKHSCCECHTYKIPTVPIE